MTNKQKDAPAPNRVGASLNLILFSDAGSFIGQRSCYSVFAARERECSLGKNRKEVKAMDDVTEYMLLLDDDEEEAEKGEKTGFGCLPLFLIVSVILLLVFFGLCADAGSRSGGSETTTAKPRTTYAYTTTTAPRTSASQQPYTYRRTTSAPKDDPFDAKDYVHADDFYYDHYDDFFDFEEAEEYWNENA